MKRFSGLLILLIYLVVSVNLSGSVRAVVKVKFARDKQVVYITNRGKRWLRSGDIIPPEGVIQTKNGRCVLTLPDGSEIKLFENSKLELRNIVFNEVKKSFTVKVVSLLRRSLFKIVRSLRISKSYTIQLPSSVIGIRGTEVFTDVDKNKNSRVGAYNGEFQVKSAKGNLKCSKGFGIFIDRNGNMKKVTLLPSPIIVSLPSYVKPHFKIIWKSVTGAKGYEVTIARDSHMNDVVFNGVIYKNQIEFFSFKKGSYFVIIQSIDNSGFLSIPQRPVRFEVKE